MRYFYAIFFLFTSLYIDAQIRIPDRALPDVGDTAMFFVDNLPQNINPGQAGADRRWNFMTLQSPFIRRSEWRNSSEARAKEQFRKAQLSIKRMENQESYYAYGKNGLMLLGYQGEDPFGLGIKNTYIYKEPITEERKDLRFGDRQSSRTKLIAICGLNDLPKKVRELLPITPDSIRLSMVSQRQTYRIGSNGK